MENDINEKLKDILDISDELVHDFLEKLDLSELVNLTNAVNQEDNEKVHEIYNTTNGVDDPEVLEAVKNIHEMKSGNPSKNLICELNAWQRRMMLGLIDPVTSKVIQDTLNMTPIALMQKHAELNGFGAVGIQESEMSLHQMMESLIEKSIIKINEAVPCAVHYKSLPEIYKNLPKLGKGMTSLVLDNGDGTVTMFTRDRFKQDWLTGYMGLRLGDHVDTLEALGHSKIKVRDFVVYVLKLPKLYKLDANNKKIVNREIDIWNKFHSNAYWGYKGYAKIDLYNKFIETYPDSILTEMFEFLLNFDPDDLSVDLGARNFMQDSNGEIVVLDPIVDIKLIQAMRN